MTWQPPIPRGLQRPRLVLVGLRARVIRRAGEASVLAMDQVILKLREQERHVEADALTTLRDEWARHIAAAVEASR